MLEAGETFLCITFPSENDGVTHNASLFCVLVLKYFRVRIRIRVIVTGESTGTVSVKLMLMVRIVRTLKVRG